MQGYAGSTVGCFYILMWGGVPGIGSAPGDECSRYAPGLAEIPSIYSMGRLVVSKSIIQSTPVQPACTFFCMQSLLVAIVASSNHCVLPAGKAPRRGTQQRSGRVFPINTDCVDLRLKLFFFLPPVLEGKKII